MLNKTELTQFLYRGRVRASLIGVIAAYFLARPNRLSLFAGAGFIILGLLLRGWACGHLTKNRELTISGPYRYTRNPLYLGSLAIALGVTAASRSWWVAGLFALNFLIFYAVTISQERRAMQELFPEAYADYSRHVPLFFPGWHPYPNAQVKSFSWNRYRSNKEYRALMAALIFLVLMGLKMFI
ncbi:MAG: isoprenylcysteine carboxylmethyltransferase family protein [Candidatus Aminicenantaceae bacterium]